MPNHPTVTREEWIAARKDLLRQEKDFTRQREELSKLRRDLPWVRIDKDYIFHGPDGHESLSDLFDGCSQLIIYHFMFNPDWTEGCKSCSLIADHYNPSIVHLRQRDIQMVSVSRAPLEKLLAFQQRMGWSFKWVSSYGSDFNGDFGVTFTQQELENGSADYNYDRKPFPVTEAPGVSVFVQDREGSLFHTYSSYARGLDILIGAYNYMDLVPKGRDEDDLSYSMEWVRHHDRYDDSNFVDPYIDLVKDK